MALDEAELPTDQLIRKLEMKEWSMNQVILCLDIPSIPLNIVAEYQFNSFP